MKATSTWGVFGHSWTVTRLQEAVSSGRVSHAYLFTGPESVGKTTVAKALAAALLCHSDANRPCWSCRACRLVENGRHPDLHILESEHKGANLKIDQIRDLQHQLSLTPIEGEWQVAILRRFEEATTSAANALLKTLEEPAPHVVLIVLASEAEQLLPTIVSRCQHIQLRPLPIALVQQALIEQWRAKPERAKLLAHLSGGRLGWAVRALKDEEMLDRRRKHIENHNKLLTASKVDRFRYAAKLARDPVEIQEALTTWIAWWRDVLMLTAGADTPLTNIDHLNTLRQYARRCGWREAKGVLDALRASTERLKTNANSRLALEILMLDLPQMHSPFGTPGPG